MKKQKLAPHLQRKSKDEPNKKLIIWSSSILGAIIVVMGVLLVLNN